MLAFPGLDAPRLSREHSVCGSKPVGLREMLQTLRSTKGGDSQGGAEHQMHGP